MSRFSKFTAGILLFGLSASVFAIDVGHLIGYLEEDRRFTFGDIDSVTGEVDGFAFENGSSPDSGDVDSVRSPDEFYSDLYDRVCGEALEPANELRCRIAEARIPNGLLSNGNSMLDTLVYVYRLSGFLNSENIAITVDELVEYANAGRSFSFDRVDIGAGKVFGFRLIDPNQSIIAIASGGGSDTVPLTLGDADFSTGPINGFRAIAPAIGTTARIFDTWANNYFDSGGLLGDPSIASTTVQHFISGGTTVANFVGGTPLLGSSFAIGGCTSEPLNTTAPTLSTAPILNNNAKCLNDIARGGGAVARPISGGTVLGGNTGVTNQFDGGLTRADNLFWDPQNPDPLFESVSETRFATFDSYVNLNTDYRQTRVEASEAVVDQSYLYYLSNGDPNSLPESVFPNHPVPRTHFETYLETPDGTRVESFIGTGEVPVEVDRLPNGAIPILSYSATGTSFPLVITYHDETGQHRCSAQNQADILPVLPPEEGYGCTLVFEEQVSLNRRKHGSKRKYGSSDKHGSRGKSGSRRNHSQIKWPGPLTWITINADQLSIGNFTRVLNPLDASRADTKAVFSYRPAVDLDTHVRVKRKRARAGDKIKFKVRVANRGPMRATGVVLTVQLPDAGLRNITAKTRHGECEVVESMVNCELGELASHKSAKVTILGRANSSDSMHASVSVKSEQFDLGVFPNSVEFDFNGRSGRHGSSGN